MAKSLVLDVMNIVVTVHSFALLRYVVTVQFVLCQNTRRVNPHCIASQSSTARATSTGVFKGEPLPQKNNLLGIAPGFHSHLFPFNRFKMPLTYNYVYRSLLCRGLILKTLLQLGFFSRIRIQIDRYVVYRIYRGCFHLTHDHRNLAIIQVNLGV